MSKALIGARSIVAMRTARGAVVPRWRTGEKLWGSLTWRTSDMGPSRLGLEADNP